jgi:hypothetical protein
MGTNFYFIEPAPKCPHCQKPIGEPTKGKHIGKRSAAGLYCYDCDDTLVKAGKARIHYGRGDPSETHDACPKCGARPPDFSALSKGAVAVELGFSVPEDERPKGVYTAASFSWASEPAKVRAQCSDYPDEVIIIDEYGRKMTGAEFLRMLRANCPIEYLNVGESFS